MHHVRDKEDLAISSTRAVTVGKERGIDQGFSGSAVRRSLFRRGDEYELSPYPPSLFEGKNLFRKPDEGPLLHPVRSHDTSSNDAIVQVIPKTDHYVLDGCSLINRLKWADGSM